MPNLRLLQSNKVEPQKSSLRLLSPSVAVGAGSDPEKLQKTTPEWQYDLLDMAENALTSIMPREKWESLADQEKQSLKSVASVIIKPPQLGVGGRMITQPSLKSLLPSQEDIEGTLYPMRQLSRPVEGIRAAIGAGIDKENILAAGVRGFLNPDEVKSLTERVPLTDWEMEGSWARLIPRATIDAIETVAAYNLTYGGADRLAKTAQTKDALAKIEQSLPVWERAGVKFPEGWSAQDKTTSILQAAQDNPQVGEVLLNVLSTPNKMYAAFGLTPFKSGDMAKYGKEVGKILRITGNKAILALAGKEVPVALSELAKPDEPAAGGGFDDYYTPDTDIPESGLAEQQQGAIYAKQNQEKIINDYTAIYGNEISTDKMRDFLEPAGFTGDNSAAFHEPASALRKILESKILSEAKAQGKADVLITAGGSGAGKTGILRRMGDYKSKFAATIDTNFADFDKAVQKIEQLKKEGFTPSILYIYREPLDAWANGVLKRIITDQDPRVVPAKEHMRMHKGSFETIVKLKEKYGDDVDIAIIDNSKGYKNEAEIGVEELKKKWYNQGGESELKEAITNATVEAYSKGIIDEAMAKGSLEEGARDSLRFARGPRSNKAAEAAGSRNLPSSLKQPKPRRRAPAALPPEDQNILDQIKSAGYKTRGFTGVNTTKQAVEIKDIAGNPIKIKQYENVFEYELADTEGNPRYLIKNGDTAIVDEVNLNAIKEVSSRYAGWGKAAEKEFAFLNTLDRAPEKPTAAVEEPKPTPAAMEPEAEPAAPAETRATIEEKIQTKEIEKQEYIEAKDELQRLKEILVFFRGRVRPFKGGFLSEELAAFPKGFFSQKGGLAPDEALEEFNQAGFGIQANNLSELADIIKDTQARIGDIEARIAELKPALVSKYELTILKESLQRIKQGERAGRKLARDEAVAVQKNIDAIVSRYGENLAPEEKERFLRGKKKILTEKQFETALPKMIDQLENMIKRSDFTVAVERIKQLFKRYPTERMPLEYKDMIEALKAGLDPARRVKGTILKRGKTVEYFERLRAQGIEINDMQRDVLHDAEKTTLGELSLDGLRSLEREIMRIYHQGLLKNKLMTSQQDKSFQEVVDNMVDTITNGQGLADEGSFMRFLQDQNPDLLKMPRDALRAYIAGHLRPEVMINALDNFSKGVFTRTMWDPAVGSEIAELEEGTRTLQKQIDFYKKIDIGKAGYKKYQIGRFQFKGKRKGMTLNNAMFIYAHSQNDMQRLHLYGSGLTDQDIADITNWLRFNHPDAYKAVQDQWDFYATDQFESLDKAYAEYEGVHMNKEDFYFPIMGLEDIGPKEAIEKEVMHRYYLGKPGVSKGMVMERVGSIKGFKDFDYFGTVYSNWRKVEHYKSHVKAIRDINKVLSDKRVKQAIIKKFGEAYYKELDKWLKDTAWGGNKTELDWINNLARFVRLNYAVNVLGLNLMTVVKQPISYMQGAEYIGKANALKASTKFASDPMRWIKFVNENDPMMKNRGFTQERDLRELKARRGARGTLGRPGLYQLVKEGSMWPILAADKATTTIIWLGAYDSYIKAGKAESDAISYAREAVRRTQPMGGTMHLPGVYRGSEIQKLYTMFTNQPNQNFNLAYESAQKVTKGKISKARFAEEQIFYMLVPALIISMLPRRRPPKDLKELGWDIATQYTGSLFLLNRIIQSMATGWWGSITPLDSYVQDIQRVTSGKEPETRRRGATGLAGKLTGIPTVGLERIFTGRLLGGRKTKKKRSLRLLKRNRLSTRRRKLRLLNR